MDNSLENPLELALTKAAKDPTQRPDFYRLLLQSEVFVLGRTEGGGEGQRTIAAGEKLSVANWQKQDGTPIIPFFTSLTALRRSIKQEQSFVALPAKALFEITRGASLVLNPGSPYGKEFFPQEIESLLAVGTNQMPQTRVVQKETNVLLGQPANYPTEMIQALVQLLSKHPSVKAAYLCLMHDPSAQEKPSLVVGFEGDDGLERAMQDAGTVAADTTPKDTPVDFVKVVPGEKGLSDYFTRSVKPFYERNMEIQSKPLFGPN